MMVMFLKTQEKSGTQVKLILFNNMIIRKPMIIIIIKTITDWEK